jgi:hypothetical protein
MPQDIQMSDDHLTLSAVCEEHDAGPKWLASATGRSLAQVYRYLSGEATIPSLIWRVLYGRTRDLRIVQLMTGDVPVVFVDVDDNRSDYERHDAPTLKQLVRCRRRHLECEENILDMLADGRIDRKDAAAFAAYQRNHPAAMQTAHKLYLQIKDEYERSR